jgi:ATP-dependent Clp protease ATP-binding subunit ClpC
MQMFQRFDERSRNAVVHAQEEARHFHHGHVGTEHLLLGLLREEEGVAAQALAALDVKVDEVRKQVEAHVGYGDATDDKAHFSANAKNTLEYALAEAVNMGHNYLGTGHILLGLMRIDDATGTKLLANLKVGPAQIRREVVSLLSKKPREYREGRLRPDLTSMYFQMQGMRKEMARMRQQISRLEQGHTGPDAA